MDRLEVKLKELPCHFTWNFESKTERDIEDLKGRVLDSLRDYPDKQVVPTKTLIGYLYMSPLNKPGKRQHHKALEWLEQAIEANDADVKEDLGAVGDKIVILSCKAWILRKLGKNPEARKLNTEIGKLQKTENVTAYLSAHEAFAGWWFGPSHYERAAKLYDTALKAYPDKEPWWFELALIVGRLERRDGATRSPEGVTREELLLRKVLTLNPNRSLARVFLGRQLAYRGKNDEAKEHFREALETDPHNVTVVQRIGEFYLRQKWLDTALSTFEKAIKLAPNSSFLVYELSLVYKHRYQTGGKNPNDVKQAMKLCEQAVELSGNGHFPAKCDRAYYTALLGEPEKARGYYSELAETQDPVNKLRAHFYFGGFLERFAKEEDNAIDQYKLAVDTNPHRFPGTKAVSILTSKMNRVLSLNGNDAYALETLGWMNERKGDFVNSITYYEKLYEVDKSNETVLKLAHLLLEQAAPNRAEKYITLLESDENFADELREVRGKYHFLKGQQVENLSDSRRQFSKSAEYGSFEGAEELLRVLSECGDGDKYHRLWFNDFVILRQQIQHSKDDDDEQIRGKAVSMESKLEDIVAPKCKVLKPLYKKYLLFLSEPGDEDALVSKAKDVLLEARSLLDRSMSEFQDEAYQLNSDQNRCSFFYVKRKKTLSSEVQQKLESEYGWKDFKSRHANLFNAILEFQPGSDYTQKKWVWYLFAIVNSDKHKRTTTRLENVGRDTVDVLQLADAAVIDVAKLIREFYVEIDIVKMINSPANRFGLSFFAV
ncbi:interferon-induced protein with tetratricopeptide repeats 5-like [Ptychodera flava]|uniref:interferon-induced protein with tetratricopeptide repeats 5-like n=1 Tax=Ptychodera flava TaxID=63121 RepID=UPI00396A286B